MTKYAKAWESEIRNLIVNRTVSEADYRKHLQHIKWLQHERLIHLMVFIFTATVMLALFVVTLFVPEPLLVVLFVIVLVVSGFYTWHYYFLENTVQRWYKIADELEGIFRNE